MILISFNFLASLINGNEFRDKLWPGFFSLITFNFLASLINGNIYIVNNKAARVVTFNFLASLINGNASHHPLPHSRTYRHF